MNYKISSPNAATTKSPGKIRKNTVKQLRPEGDKDMSAKGRKNSCVNI